MENVRLVLSGKLLAEAMRRLRRSNPAVAYLSAGFSRRCGGVDWLGRRLLGLWDGNEPAIVITGSATLEHVSRAPAIVLHLTRQSIPAVYLLHPNGQREPVALHLLVPGLPERDGHSVHPLHTSWRWSRTAGALGAYAWRRLCELRYTVVGCGRTGSLIAHTLIRNGVDRLTLIDPDEVELSNLDSDGFLPDHLGQLKTSALSDSLRVVNPLAQIEAIPESVTSLAALPALKEADVLICAVDHDGARWACGLFASLYLKPMLDVGTGILHIAEGGRQMGADVRWVIPGERCLMCMGGVARLEHIAVVREGALQELQHRQTRNWRQERAGSLRSLNQIAAGLALRMLEEYLACRLRTSLWLRLTYEGAIPTIRQMPLADSASGCLCQIAGGGDEVLASLER